MKFQFPVHQLLKMFKYLVHIANKYVLIWTKHKAKDIFLIMQIIADSAALG